MSARPKYIAWIDGAPTCSAMTAEESERKAREWIAGSHFQHYGTFPVRLRITTYGTQRLISEHEVQS